MSRSNNWVGILASKSLRELFLQVISLLHCTSQSHQMYAAIRQR